MKFLGQMILLGSGIVILVLAFTLILAIFLTAIFLAIACGCELWDIYLSGIFRRIRKRRDNGNKRSSARRQTDETTGDPEDGIGGVSDAVLDSGSEEI